MKDYLTYWHVSQPVFTYPVHSEDVFCTDSLKKIIERVFLFSKHGGNLIVLTAPAGHGKSSLGRYLYEALPTANHEVLLISLINDEHKSEWLMPQLAAFFGVTIEERDTYDYLRTEILKRFDDLIEEGKQLLVFIDSAEKLKSIAALQEIHTLLGLQAISKTCLSFILAGSESFGRIINTSPLVSRATLLSQVKPLNQNEIEQYLKHQLRISGIDENIFKKTAFKPITELSGGIYARINAIAENCLIEACLQNKKTIDAATVSDASEFISSLEQAIPKLEFPDEKNLATKTKGVKVPQVESENTDSHQTEDETKTQAGLKISKNSALNESTKASEDKSSIHNKTKPKLEPQQAKDQPIKLKNLFKNDEAG